VIVRDEDHPLGARITLERRTPTAPFAITCGVYGWMVHTRFFSDERGAKAEYADMRDALTSILNIVPEASDAENNEKMRPCMRQWRRSLSDFLNSRQSVFVKRVIWRCRKLTALQSFVAKLHRRS
jgi:hypothetical protein